MVNPNKGNLGSKVFFVWGSTCVLCLIYAYLFIWETKGLTLEQVDRMMEECGAPRKSPGWKAHSMFAAEMGIAQDAGLPVKQVDGSAADEKVHLAAGTKAHQNETV
jgi:SP family sugar:H+ symporter-like MFS transporter